MDIYKVMTISNLTKDNLSFLDNQNNTSEINRRYLAILIVPIIVSVAMGNIFVITAVCLDRKLQSATNYFLTSLAVADLLVALTVMPPSLIMIINNYEWPLSERLCGVWVMLDVLFSTSSILHLCMISLDRYFALARPFKHRGNSNKLAGLRLGGDTRSTMTKRVATRIFVVWAVSFGIALPLLIVGVNNRDNIFYANMCTINVAEFQIFGSLAAFFLPLTIMFIMYTLTIRTLQKQARLVASIMVPMSKYSPLTSKGIRKIKSMDAGCESPTLKCKSDHVVTNSVKRSDSPTTESDSESLKSQNRSLRSKHETGRGCKFCEEKKAERRRRKKIAPGFVKVFQRITKLRNNEEKSEKRELTNYDKLNKCKCSYDKKQKEWKDRRSYIFQRKLRSSGRRMSTSFKNRAMASINNEQRASKVLGLIFVLFCVFWCPFFVTNVLSRLCTTCDQDLLGGLMNWFVWIGYVSSGVNPLVYTMFSKQFRSTFSKLARGRFQDIKSRPFRRTYSSQHNNLSGASFRTLGGSVHGRRPSLRPVVTSQHNDVIRSRVAERTSEDWIENVKSAAGVRTRKFDENDNSDVIDAQRWRSTWHAADFACHKPVTTPARSTKGKRKRHYSASDVRANKADRLISIISETPDDVGGHVTTRTMTLFELNLSKDSLWSSEQSINDRLDEIITRDDENQTNDVIENDVTRCKMPERETNYAPTAISTPGEDFNANSRANNSRPCYKKEAFSRRTDSGMGASFEANHPLIMT